MQKQNHIATTQEDHNTTQNITLTEYVLQPRRNAQQNHQMLKSKQRTTTD